MGRLSDLMLVSRPDSDQFRTERAFDAAVFDTGRPTLVLPRYVPAGILDHLLVAWNGSLEAARAVAGAMPLLHEAKQVSVFSALEEGETGEPDLDLAGALRWQGINAARLRPGTVAGSVGAEFLRTAAHQSATLLVMGAYTHRRLQQMLLGGVTSPCPAAWDTAGADGALKPRWRPRETFRRQRQVPRVRAR